MFLLRYLSRLDPSHADTSIPLQNIKKINVKPTADPDSCINKYKIENYPFLNCLVTFLVFKMKKNV